MRLAYIHTPESRSNQYGFTILELLIVVVIIAIIATISFIAFSSVQTNTARAVLQSDLKNASTQLELDKVQLGDYPDDDSSLVYSDGTNFEYTKTGDGYCLTAWSNQAKTNFYVNSTTGGAIEGVCTGHGGYSEVEALAWDYYPSAVSGNIGGVAYGNGLYVMVKTGGGAQRVVTSSDGINWISRNSPYDGSVGWQHVTYGNGRFVAGSSDGRVMTSTDGVTWNGYDTGYACQTDASTYGDGMFAILINHCGDEEFYAAVATSADGIQWVTHPLPEGYWGSIAYGNDRFVVSGEDGLEGSIHSATVVSNDNWNTSVKYTSAPTVSYNIGFDGSSFIMIDSYTGVYSSIDGISWTSRVSPSTPVYQLGFAYAPGRILASGEAGLFESSDSGATWTKRNTSMSFRSAFALYGDGYFLFFDQNKSLRIN